MWEHVECYTSCVSLYKHKHEETKGEESQCWQKETKTERSQNLQSGQQKEKQSGYRLRDEKLRVQEEDGEVRKMRKRNEEERAAQLMNCGTAGDSDNRGREQGEQRVEYVTD